MAHPQVDVVPLGGERVDAEPVAPAGPGLEVAAVGGRGVGRVADQPAGRPQDQAERGVERGQRHGRHASRRRRQTVEITFI
jgi:hypothetical protein